MRNGMLHCPKRLNGERDANGCASVVGLYENSYNYAEVFISKSYAASGTSSAAIAEQTRASHRPKGRASRFRVLDPPQSACLQEALTAFGAPRRWELQMLDIIVLAIGLGLFALSVGYTFACDRL